MNIGERFRPYRLFVGSFLPNWLLKSKDVSVGAKVCYARLCQFAGERNDCRPSQETLATELGVTVRQVRRYLAELEESKLVEGDQRGLGQSNVYFFLWHESMNDPDRTNMSGQGGQECPVRQDKYVRSTITKRESLEERYSGKLLIPTVQEVESLMRSRGLSGYELTFQAEQFWHFYNSKGWKVGKAPMTQASSAVAGWVNRFKKAQTKPLWAQIKDLKSELETHKGNWNWIGHGHNYTVTNEVTDDFKAKSAKLRDLESLPDQANGSSAE